LEVTVERRSKPKPARRPQENKEPPAPQPAPQVLADVHQYVPGQIERLEPDGQRGAPSSVLRGLRPPRAGESGVPSRAPSGTPGGRYSNIDIENAAAGFVAEYEWQRGGFELKRQGSGVGADYVAVRDGEIDRYIEIKSSKGNKDVFDMTRNERIAAMKPDIGSMYWIYVVEHLGDGQDPTVTAVWNPVADEGVSKEPKGSIAVKGWRTSERQWSLIFARAGRPTGTDVESIGTPSD